jgi:integrase
VIGWGVMWVLAVYVAPIIVDFDRWLPSMGFYDFDEYEKLIEAAKNSGTVPHIIVLLGGDAGLRCGEIIGLEWGDVDFAKRQLCVQRSEWRGHVTVPKGGRVRHVPMTVRLASALRSTAI